MAEKIKEKGSLSIHTENIFPIIKKWLYSEHDIFVRELISNAVDAMSKRKAVDANLDLEKLKINVSIDKKKKTLEFNDTGIGMNAEEVKKYINQIAFSGAEDFVEKYKNQQSNIIGHFGLGFYSSFMVSEKVTIDTLSYQENSEPVYWECDGSTEYILGKGKRKEVGTTITLYLNEESGDYLEDMKIQEILEKFCNFMPFPIEMGDKKINLTEALWNKKPTEVTEEQYKEFYKSMFKDWEDPLFWIHLNVDFPFNLKGILYFPKIKNEFDINKGRVKLYCNNVFVADNLKDFIPEFLLLLKGGIDIPDIPLNVSRSFLQQDKEVKKITGYIIKKVSDHFHDVFKTDRKKYETYWEDINNFIKYGILTDKDFAESMDDIIIFKSTIGDYVTLEEYKLRNSTVEKERKIYYTSSEDMQVTYLNLMKEHGIEVLITSSPLDGHIFQNLEMKHTDLRFSRIDSEINDVILNKNVDEVKDADNKTESDKIKEAFETALNNPDVTIDPKSLKSESISGMIVFEEFMRRFQEMNSLGMNKEADLLKRHTLVVNTANPTVKKVMEFKTEGREEDAALLANYIHDLSLLEQKRFDGEELKSFIEKSNKIMGMVK